MVAVSSDRLNSQTFPNFLALSMAEAIVRYENNEAWYCPAARNAHGVNSYAISETELKLLQATTQFKSWVEEPFTQLK